MEIALTISLVLLVVAVLACVVLVRKVKSLAADRDEVNTEREELAQLLSGERERVASLNGDLGVLKERLEGNKQQLEDFKQQINTNLKAMTGDALKDSREQFVKQAAEQLKPVSEALQRLHEAERMRKQDHGSLVEQLRHLGEDQKNLRQETGNLVKALRRPEVRGRWGELQMKRLFDLAGLTERFDYDEQAKVDSADGPSLRPDFTIHLPNDRVIVVDVKTPLDAYLDATNATDDAQREELLTRHAKQVKTAADNLASKAYWASCAGSPEFVVMFLPAESMLYAAVRYDPELIEKAMEKNVIIATPTVVMALLKTVAMGWREQQMAENAARISEAGREMHQRLSVLFAHLTNLQKAIGKTNEHFNKVVGSLESSVLPQARRFEQLGAASPKQVNDVPQIEVMPRELSTPQTPTNATDGEA